MSDVLKLENLSVSLPRGRAGNVTILDELNLTVGAGEMLALVGESGSGKTIAALSVMRLLPRGARVQGSIQLAGTELTSLDDRAMRGVRGRDVGMVFQNPLAALNPSRTVAAQIQEAWRVHQGGSVRAARARALDLMGEVGIPEPGAAAGRLSAPILRRHAPARDDRHGAGLLAKAVDRRRANHRPRPADRAADHAIDRKAAARACDGRAVRHPRSFGGRGTCRCDPRAVCRAQRGVRWRPGVFRPPAPPVQCGAPELGGAPGPDAAAEHSRPAAGAGSAAGGCRFAPRCAYHQPACDAAYPALVSNGGTAAACLFPLPAGGVLHAAPLVKPAGRNFAPQLEVQNLSVRYAGAAAGSAPPANSHPRCKISRSRWARANAWAWWGKAGPENRPWAVPCCK